MCMKSRNVLLLYGIIFFHHLIPAYVIERLFWEERGMSVLDVVFCEMIYAGTIIIFEIPSGILADKFGRKRMLVIGSILSFLEIFILLFAYHFWVFGLGVFLAGIATACTSGSRNALLYDTLVLEKRENQFEKIVGRMNALDLVAVIIAAISGGILANIYHFEFNYMISSISLFFVLLLTCFLREVDVNKNLKGEMKDDRNFLRLFSSAIHFFRNQPSVVRIMIHSMAIAACMTYMDEFWQLYLNEIGWSVLFFGVFSALISIISIPGNLFAGYLLHVMKAQTIIMIVLLMITTGFFLTALIPNVFGVIVMAFMFLVSGVVEPIVTGYLHRRTESFIRATVDSFQSLLERIFTLTIGIGFGAIANSANIFTGFFFLGIVMLLFTISYFLLNQLNKMNLVKNQHHNAK